MLLRAHVGTARVNFKPLGAYLRLKRAQYKFERGPSKVKWVKMASFHFWEGDHSNKGHSMTNFTPVNRAQAALLAVHTVWMVGSHKVTDGERHATDAKRGSRRKTVG